MRRTSQLTAALTLTLALTACGAGGDSDTGDASGPLRVGASPVPHADILEFIDSTLAEDAGLDLEVVEFTDYIQPNVALEEGQLDANYFQTVPYLDEQVASRGYEFTALEGVHIEPLGLYSTTVESLEELPAGASVAIPNDPTNAGRALQLLAANGVVELADTGDAAPTSRDVVSGDIALQEVEAAQIPRSLQDVDAAVINGNYAIEADLSPAEDSLALEDAENNPNANLLVVRTGDQDDERVATLERLLHSDEVRTFIDDTYDGAVLPAF